MERRKKRYLVPEWCLSSFGPLPFIVVEVAACWLCHCWLSLCPPFPFCHHILACSYFSHSTLFMVHCGQAIVVVVVAAVQCSTHPQAISRAAVHEAGIKCCCGLWLALCSCWFAAFSCLLRGFLVPGNYVAITDVQVGALVRCLPGR